MGELTRAEVRAQEKAVVAALRALATERGVRLGHLETAIGEKQGYLSALERGRRPVRLDRLLPMLAVLETEPLAFFERVWPRRDGGPVGQAEVMPALHDVMRRLDALERADAASGQKLE